MRRLSVTMEVRRLAAFRMPAIISCVAAAWSKSFAGTHTGPSGYVQVLGNRSHLLERVLQRT